MTPAPRGARAANAIVVLGVLVTATSGLLLARPWESGTADTAFGLAPSPSVAYAAGTRREASASGAIGRLEIARLDLSVPVVEGTGRVALLRGVGHVLHTAYPGEPGNVALAGHRDTHFAKLRDVAAGDSIRLTTPDGSFVYRVDSTFVVAPDRGDLLDPTSEPVLTLVTCHPFGWFGHAPNRFIVRARPVTAGV